MIEESIKTKISEILNDNSHDVEFDVALYTFNRNDRFLRSKLVDKSYDIEENKYIMALIESIETVYEPVRGHTIANPAIFMSFSIPVSDTYVNYERVKTQPNFKSVLSAINELREKYQGEIIPLGDVGYQLKYQSDFKVDFDGEDVKKIGFKIKPMDKHSEVIIEDVLTRSEENFSIFGQIIPYTPEKSYDFEIVFGTGNEIELVIDENGSNIFREEIVFSTNLEELNVKEFNGYIYYIGLGKDNNDGYNFKLIEDFEDENDIIPDNPDKYGAVPFGEDGDLSLTFGNLEPTSQRYDFGVEGISHMVFDYALDSRYSKDIYYANHYKVYLDGYRIQPFSKDNGYSGEADADQYINNNTVESLISDNILANAFTFYFKNSYILKKMFRKYNNGEVEQNDTWTMKIEYPTHNEEFDVVVKDLGANTTDGNNVIFSFQVERADKIL